jgi:hypothetical protein
LENKDENENEKKSILEKFKQETNEILIKYKEIDWDRYINIYSKIMRDDDILYSFFSPKEHKQNQKALDFIKNQIQDFQNLVTTIIGKSQIEPHSLIKKLKKSLKDDYINKLNNKKDFNENKIIINDNDV